MADSRTTLFFKPTTYTLPLCIHIQDLYENGKILPDSEIQRITTTLTKDGRYTKAQANCSYPIIVFRGRHFAVYHGTYDSYEIGVGAYGYVKALQELQTGDVYALKAQSEMGRLSAEILLEVDMLFRLGDLVEVQGYGLHYQWQPWLCNILDAGKALEKKSQKEIVYSASFIQKLYADYKNHSDSLFLRKDMNGHVIVKQNNRYFVVHDKKENWWSNLQFGQYALAQELTDNNTITNIWSVLKYVGGKFKIFVLNNHLKFNENTFNWHLPVKEYRMHHAVMRFARGMSLYQWNYSFPKLPLIMYIKVMIDALNGLEKIALKRVFHKDMKPENIVVDADLTVKIVDFGLAGSADVQGVSVGNICGSPQYWAPELWQALLDHDPANLLKNLDGTENHSTVLRYMLQHGMLKISNATIDLLKSKYHAQFQSSTMIAFLQELKKSQSITFNYTSYSAQSFPYSEQQSIYSVGLVFGEMVGLLLKNFLDLRLDDAKKTLGHDIFKDTATKERFFILLRTMLDLDPKQRKSFAELHKLFIEFAAMLTPADRQVHAGILNAKDFLNKLEKMPMKEKVDFLRNLRSRYHEIYLVDTGEISFVDFIRVHGILAKQKIRVFKVQGEPFLCASIAKYNSDYCYSFEDALTQQKLQQNISVKNFSLFALPAPPSPVPTIQESEQSRVQKDRNGFQLK